MALAGACPGTMLVQISAGVRTGLFTLSGAILGGIIWTGFLSKAVKSHNDKNGIKCDVATLNNQLGLSKPATIALFEAICIGIVVSTTLYTSKAPEPRILGFVGGLLIGSAQLLSIITRRSMMGISGSYEEIGKYFWWLVGGADAKAQPGYGNILFASGVAAGGWVLAQLMPEFVRGPVTEVSPALAATGGALMILGSRMAGGCTSGHGISGISLLSTSSIITIMSAFAAGGAVALSVY